MKKLLVLVTLGIFLVTGCQKQDGQLLEQISKLEKRIEALEKRLSAAPGQAQPPAEQTDAFDLPVGSSYVKGNPNAPVTLTKFSDIQCPFCYRAQETFVNKIFEDPELKDKVKVVYKHYPLPFHKSARPAAKAALAAGEQGSDCFWAMTDKLYAGQKTLSDDNFKKWAKEVSCTQQSGKKAPLNVDKFWSDYKANDAKYEKMIQDDMNLGQSKAFVRGTPSFFLNGWKLNQRSVEGLKQMIKEKGLVAGGAGHQK